ncbi:NUDIX domain-containing protein [Amycolatopsis palatopharyngis]|uniref:NUDIX domain-containing protein n=1 Tax=Amycolatopsis palatopharyngis TaxID=187982 RepID=UPI000E22E147|nr:NUDIX domain-containing protein [Amycolatopsis palatopharyngis]
MGAAATEIIARAVIRRDGHLLLATQRTKSWSFLPGGHVEPGERVEPALIREITEELGTEATIARFLGVVEHGYIEDDTTHHELNFVFEVDLADSEPTSQEAHLEFHWCPVDDLAESDVRPRTLKDALLAPADEQTPFWRAWAS